MDSLKYKHRKELKSFLDDRHCISGNWLDLGKLIFQGNRDMIDLVDHLNLQYYGGGSPGGELIEYLQIDPKFTVKSFVDVVKDLNRKDILQLVENVPSHTPFRDLHATLSIRIAMYLDKDIAGVNNWRDFADAFGCTDEQVKAFKAAKRTSDASPTDGLLDLIKSALPNYKLADLKSKLVSIRRNDVAGYIGKVIETLS